MHHFSTVWSQYTNWCWFLKILQKPCDRRESSEIWEWCVGTFIFNLFSIFVFYSETTLCVIFTAWRSCSQGTPAERQWIRNDDRYIWHGTNVATECQPPLSQAYSDAFKIQKGNTKRRLSTSLKESWPCFLPFPDSLALLPVQYHTTEQTGSVCVNVTSRPSIAPILRVFFPSKFSQQIFLSHRRQHQHNWAIKLHLNTR